MRPYSILKVLKRAGESTFFFFFGECLHMSPKSDL